MALVTRFAGPRMIERGVAQSLTFPVFSAAGAEQTATAATVTLQVENRTVLAATAATSLGPPASYSLLAATTTSEALSDRWLETWAMTIGGTPYTFRRAAYLVRHVFYPTITDTDLTDVHAELTELLDSDVDDYSRYREAAREKIERHLIKKGRRPELIFDNWALYDAHRALTLHLIFRDYASSIGDGRYTELAAEYLEEWKSEIESVRFRYDDQLSGTIDSGDKEGGEPSIILTSAPRNRQQSWRGARSAW